MCITIHYVQTSNFVSSKWLFEKKMSRKLLYNCKIHYIIVAQLVCLYSFLFGIRPAGVRHSARSAFRHSPAEERLALST